MSRALVVLVAVTVVVAAYGAEWATEDGLAVTLDDASGAVTAVSVDGEALTLLAGHSGGLYIQDFHRADETPEERMLLDFDGDVGWTSAVGAEWEAGESYADQAGGVLRLGDGEQAGAGMATAEPIPMWPGELVTISWRARAAESGMTTILCVRPLGEDGEDVSASTSPPAGWQYTPYSRAHYVVGFRPGTEWRGFEQQYVVPPGVTAARLSLRVYTGGALRAEIDDLRVNVRPGGWGPEYQVEAPISGAGPLQQVAALRGLYVETRYEAHAGHLAAEVSVRAGEAAEIPRAFRLSWRLPVDAREWQWSAGPDEGAVIGPGAAYEDPLAFAGHPVGRYPLATVVGEGTALAMATPLDPPALQGFRYDGRGLSTSADMALDRSDRVVRMRFALYRHAPQWAFRAALERYYAIFPALFEGRADEGGCWTLRLPDPETEAPGDFGLAFHECGSASAAEQAWCRERGVRTFRYIEPWGVRQNFPDAETRGQMPALDERLAELRTWAAEGETGETWLGASRNRMAQAVLGSMMIGADGRPLYKEDLYSHWATWWQTNSDPDLPSPNRADISRETRIDPALEWADGIYVDSVSGAHIDQEDHAPAHLAAGDLPPTFSLQTGTPVVLSGQAHAEFLTWLREYLHVRGRLLMCNLFPPATRLVGHLPDVSGCELVGLQTMHRAIAQRIYARHRPVSNLLQWKRAVLERVPAATSEEMRAYFENQLVYGFWPGISTAGGGTEPGYRGMQRYFRTPELMERDRVLFREYIPLFDALNEAGWEPVPHVHADPDLRVERFGEDLLTVHNSSESTVSGGLMLDTDWWGAIDRIEHLGGGEDPLKGSTLTLKPNSTVVLRVVRGGQ